MPRAHGRETTFQEDLEDWDRIAEEVRDPDPAGRRGHRPGGAAGRAGRAQAALPAVHHDQPQPHPARSRATTPSTWPSTRCRCWTGSSTTARCGCSASGWRWCRPRAATDRARRAARGRPSRRPRPGRRRSARRPARCRWYDAPRAGMSSTEASSAEQPSRSATGLEPLDQVREVVGDQPLVGVGVEDDDRVEPVAGGAPLVLLDVPRRHRRQRLAGGQPGVEVDDQAVHERDQRGEVGEGRDAVADPVLEGAEVRRRAGRPSGSRSSSSITPVVSWSCDERLELRPRRELERQPGGRQLLEHQRPVGGVAGVDAGPDRRGRRERLEVRVVVQQRGQHRHAPASRSGSPTWTCTPQISICRPHHWVRLISSS